MIKVCSIVGARPQFVKLAPLSRAIRERGWEEIIVHTGQHYDENMSGRFFRELRIPDPDFNLEIGSGDPGAQCGRMMEQIERVLVRKRPDVVVVFGDTNSTLAGALAANKKTIPVVHVEAGLRSFNRTMPEEINRVVADHVSDVLIAPTQSAMRNLKREGLGNRAVLGGDIMVDAVKSSLENREQSPAILQLLGLESGLYSLLTLHRPYTVDDPGVMQRLFEELSKLNETIVFPVHPRTRKTLELIGMPLPGTTPSKTTIGGVPIVGGRETRLKLIEPVGYLDSLLLQSNARRVITDSGGVQKEAYILRKPCVTLRPETEWVETVEAGWNLLLPPGLSDLAERIRSFVPPSFQPAVFGENVALRMTDAIHECAAWARERQGSA